MVRLSFIIPCYNMERYLSICLDSILDQEMQPDDYEVIIVNDESKDRTLEIAREYTRKHANFITIDKKNAGVGAARNTGLDESSGQYIYFLDPDDYLATGTMPAALKVAEDLELDILTFETRSVGKDEYLPQSSSDLEGVAAMNPVTMDGIEYIARHKYKNEIWWYLLRRDFLMENDHRFVEGRWMEDAILSAQLFCSAKQTAHLPLNLHRYRILPTSAMRNKTPEHYRKVIFDNANAAHVFDRLLKSLDRNHPDFTDAYRRLKTRQQSFVFFLLVRLMKSDLSVNKIPPMLRGFKDIGAYPLDQFLGQDYHGPGYSFMVFIFNNKALINPFIHFFRFFYRFRSTS